MRTARQLEIPTRSWVPDRLAVATVVLILLPIAMLNGSYTGSIVEVSNTLGVYSEDITIGYYAASAGMAVSYPIVPKILAAFSGKSLLLIDLTLQFLLSWFCAAQANIDLLIAASFVIGFLKGFLMLWIIRRIKFIFSPRDIRSEFYAYFYPLVFGGGQLSMVITALLAYHYDWKYMYYFMMFLLLLAILAVVLFFRPDRPLRPIPWKELHGREMLIISTGLLMLIYLITYGKTLDWMASPRICLYIVVAPLLVALFLWEQFHSPPSVREFEAPVRVENHSRVFLHDAGYVFQYLHQPAYQLPHDNSEGGQYSKLHALYLVTARLSRGGFYLFLVVSLATVALPFPRGRGNGVLCLVLRDALFRSIP